MFSRRDFLRLGALAAGSLALPRALRADARAIPVSPTWSGDEFDFVHDLFQAGPHAVPSAAREPAGRFDVIVVGGGLSGLAAAHALGGASVLVLESASTAGGNAKKESWNGVDYAIGSAYLIQPDPGDALDVFYRGIDAPKFWRATEGDASAFQHHRLVRDLWENGTSPANRDGFRAARDYFVWILEHAYPGVPFVEGGDWARAEFERLDRMPFGAFLQEGVAWKEDGVVRRIEAFHPAVRELLEYYCVSSFGARAGEVSAWYGLNFVTAEFGGVAALPGNAGIVDLLLARLERAGTKVETGRPVVRVEWDAARERARVISAVRDGGRVEYRVDEARAVILATSKLVASRLVEMPGDQAEAVGTLRYNPYVVANVLLDRRAFTELYDAYLLDGASPDEASFAEGLAAKPFTDLVVADWARGGRGDASVLTLYRGFPSAEPRMEILGAEPEAFGRPVAEEIALLLAANGTPAEAVREVRMTRWGHPMIVANPGQLSSGVLDVASRPVGGIFFAQQDTFGGPAIENAILAGLRAADEARDLLG